MNKMTEGILVTYYLNFDGTEAGSIDSEMTKLSRKAMLHQLQQDQNTMLDLELDLVDDYKETIDYLTQLNDAEYEEAKRKLLSGVVLPAG